MTESVTAGLAALAIASAAHDATPASSSAVTVGEASTTAPTAAASESMSSSATSAPTADTTAATAVAGNGSRTWQENQDRIARFREQWVKEQMAIAAQVVCVDRHEWAVEDLKLIGGVDISFIKGNDDDACASLIVMEFPSKKVVYEDFAMVKLTQPYIAGFLAFREVEFLIDRIDKLRKTRPELMPQIILVDGNGVLHYEKCGLACHLGVLTDIPTIGVGKNLLNVDGLQVDDVHEAAKQSLHKKGDFLLLQGDSGYIWGAALRAADNAPNPIYISIGHRVSLETAIRIATITSDFRIPEPVRQADQRSRQYLRDHPI